MLTPEEHAVLLAFPAACPGCDQDFDPRRHTEKWCRACRPEDGSCTRLPTGSEDGRVPLEYLGGGSSDTDPANQRAAGALWGEGR